MDVGQSVVTVLEPERQAGVVDAQAVQDRRVHVVNVDRIPGDVVREIVRLAIGQSAFDAAVFT